MKVTKSRRNWISKRCAEFPRVGPLAKNRPEFGEASDFLRPIYRGEPPYGFHQFGARECFLPWLLDSRLIILRLFFVTFGKMVRYTLMAVDAGLSLLNSCVVPFLGRTRLLLRVH